MGMIAKAKPILKWAGGKRQMLSALVPYLPNKPYRYVEPMIGGGALFFALSPEEALIADSNPELINLYESLRDHALDVAKQYAKWRFHEDQFYELRALDFNDLEPVMAAARTIYLNRTCFNGLYRVNKSGAFNVPWGKYKKTHEINLTNLSAVQAALQKCEILLGDFRNILQKKAKSGDFIFLDPPYIPVSEYADFKRYTREQFCDDDHRDMATLAIELSQRGCDVLITNSNHPLVHDLYRGYQIEVFPTKRNVNSKSTGRTGEDAVIYVPST
jgi:DNA adenine methylase